MKVLFVCTGNICRSPTAEGVFRHLVHEAGLQDRVHIDSCGIGGWHVGEPPDDRSQDHALKRGYDLSDQRARKLKPSDFETFDLLLAMDNGHLRSLQSMAPESTRDRVKLFMTFSASGRKSEVPDPYYGARDGFELVLDMVEDGSRGLLKEVERRLAG